MKIVNKSSVCAQKALEIPMLGHIHISEHVCVCVYCDELPFRVTYGDFLLT